MRTRSINSSLMARSQELRLSRHEVSSRTGAQTYLVEVRNNRKVSSNSSCPEESIVFRFIPAEPAEQ